MLLLDSVILMGVYKCINIDILEFKQVMKEEKGVFFVKIESDINYGEIIFFEGLER